MAVVIMLGFMASCANNEGGTKDSTKTMQQVNDTNHLVTDSVAVPDTNTAEIDAMKKRN